MNAFTARRMRQIHRYVGVFFTPAILFFSLSGALQTLGLHENHGGGSQPPTWIRWIASVHKDQRPLGTDAERPHPAPPQLEHHGSDDHAKEAGPSPVPLKAFVVLLALGLALSSTLGMVIVLTMPSTRKVAAIMFALGVIVPVAFLYI